MFYGKKIEVKPGYTEDNPLEVELKLEEKWITNIAVSFEDGCGWEVGVRVYYGIKRYFPANPGEWIWGNNETYYINTIVKLPAKWESIKIHCISPNCKYEHRVFIYVWTSEEEPAPVDITIKKLLEEFQKVFGV